MKHVELLLSVTSLALASAPRVASQTDSQGEASSRPTVSQKIQWPQDRERVICVVNGVRHTVGDLVAYLEKQHAPGLTEFLKLRSGRLYFTQTPYPARWVRQYADIMALSLEARQRGVDRATIDTALSDSLKAGFEAWLERFTRAEARRGRSGDLSQQAINAHLSSYQRQFGLETEVVGWLSALVPATPLEADGLLRDYYADHARFFGGRVTVSEIFLRNRDPRTGELLVGEAHKRFERKRRDVESRLADDGSNFDTIADMFSERSPSTTDGHVLRNIKRFDERLPAETCRYAWGIPDGAVHGPFETPFGVHWVRRISYKQLSYAIFTQQFKPQVVTRKRQHEQEDVLFAVREKYGVELRF